MSEIIAALLGAVSTGITTWWFTRGNVKSDLWQKNQLLSSQLDESNEKMSELTTKADNDTEEVARLAEFEQKYNRVRCNLTGTNVVKDYLQPVILLGPRAVGKTSLLMQWHAPWNHGHLSPTQSHKIATVPIYDFEMTNMEPHFADPEILTTVQAHLKLRVHDFPGELSAQQSVTQQAISDTEDFRSQTQKNLGVVLICMFDASEAAAGGLQSSTLSYYNGDLFASLRTMVSHRSIEIQRLVLVFNKYDLLCRAWPNENDRSLFDRCKNAFAQVLIPLHGTCNPEKICEIFTILEREHMITNNRGAPIVLGEAARGLVQAMAGSNVVREIVPDGATTYFGAEFPRLP